MTVCVVIALPPGNLLSLYPLQECLIPDELHQVWTCIYIPFTHGVHACSVTIMSISGAHCASTCISTSWCRSRDQYIHVEVFKTVAKCGYTAFR